METCSLGATGDRREAWTDFGRICSLSLDPKTGVSSSWEKAKKVEGGLVPPVMEGQEARIAGGAAAFPPMVMQHG